MDTFLSKIELQKILFGEELNRLSLQSCQLAPCNRTVKIHVFRNHAFEPVASVIAPFLSYSGIAAEFSYSAYDDTFSFSDIPDNADTILVWIDLDHYGEDIDLKFFLSERLSVLRAKNNADIVLVASGSRMVDWKDFHISGCYIASTDMLRSYYGGILFDERLQRVTATRLSNIACLQVARWLGMVILPPIFLPNLKAIVLDLDNTLYKGVLGEDGIDGVVLTQGHRYLQEKLKELKDEGFFLSIVSKNEIEDVQKMFEKRKDFPLKWDDFSAVGISWQSKSLNMSVITQQLRIAPDSLLFIDDNIGEVVSVVAEFPDIRFILADSIDGCRTKDILSFYPGLFKWHKTDDDMKRVMDLRSNEVREKLQQSLTQEEYIQELNLQIAYHVNSRENLVRIAELGNKTNQFILSYTRLKEQDFEKIMNRAGCDVVDFSLKDRLSDSGLIGAIITKFVGETLFVEDIFVSCRALGRGIEDVMILKAIDVVRKKYAPKEVQVCYKKGERNKPALMWLEKVSGCTAGENGSIIFPENLFQIESNHILMSVE